MKSTALMKNWELRTERKLRGWTQAELAKVLGISTKTVVRWELGLSVPFPYYRQKLSILFGKTPQQLGLIGSTDENKTGQETLSSGPQK